MRKGSESSESERGIGESTLGWENSEGGGEGEAKIINSGDLAGEVVTGECRLLEGDSE